MSTDESFSLNVIIREIMDEATHLGPDAVATEVAGRIPAEHRDAVFTAALRTHVRMTMNTQRSTPVGKLSPLPPRSAKGEAIRAWAVEQRNGRLTEQLHVGGGEWKLLADCTADNLRFAAADRVAHASQLLAKAEAFEALANVMDQLSAKTVKDLPDTVVDSTLPSEA